MVIALSAFFLLIQLSEATSLSDLTRAEADQWVQSLRSSETEEAELKLGESRLSSIPALVAGLKDSNSRVRERCVDILGRIGDPAAAGPLVERLKDSTPSVRLETIEALCHGLAYEPAAPAVLELFADPDEEVRRQATHYISRLKSSRALLLKAMTANRELVRAGAIQALRDHEDPSYEQYLQLALRDASPLVRAAACEVMFFSVSDATLPVLIETARDPDPRVRIAAADALRGGHEDRLRKAADAALIRLLADPEPTVREAALEALAMGQREVTPAELLESLDACLDNSNPKAVIIAALNAVADTHAESLLERCKILMRSNDPATAGAAANAVCTLAGGGEVKAAAMKIMIGILETCPDEEVRGQAAGRLAFLRAPDADAAVRKALLNDSSQAVRRTCAIMLSNASKENAIALAKAINDVDEDVAFSAGWTLIEARDVDTVDIILKATHHPSGSRRARAAQCLARLDDKRVVPRLIEMMNDRSDSVRLQVAGTFEHKGDSRALSSLAKMAKLDWSRAVRQSAAAAVRRLESEGQGM